VQVLDWADATSYEKPQVPLSPPGSDCFRNLAYFLPWITSRTSWLSVRRRTTPSCAADLLSQYAQFLVPGLHPSYDLTTVSSVGHLSLVTAATLACHI